MKFLQESCNLKVLSEYILLKSNPFDCGNSDLNDFFMNDSLSYAKELLGKTYAFVLDKNASVIIAAFTVSNDSLRTDEIPKSRKNKINRPIPNTKRTKSYPAVLIGRLGVNKDFRGLRIGNELMDFIKEWFTVENKTGCRFLVVDSYNEEVALSFYSKCGFMFLFDDEEMEKLSLHLSSSDSLNTRAMYFDLINIV